MSCPKCKAKIGLHRYESRTHVHLAQGAACCVCGYWLDRCTRAEEKAGKRAGKKVKRR